MRRLLDIFSAVILSVFVSVSFVEFVPLSWFDSSTHNFGATITTINGSDTISSSRSVINTNFSNLNTNKFELSDWYATTSANHITTLNRLTTIGTITSGTWNGTTIAVANGGTSSTTLSSNQVILGNGTGAVKVVAGYGNSGQSLVSNGTGAAPTWQSISFDQTANYTLTGQWSFNGASSTNFAISNYLKWNGQIYTINGAAPASSTVLTANASNQLFWSYPTPLRYSSTGSTGISLSTDTFATSTKQLILPANVLIASSTASVDGTGVCQAGAGGTETCTVYLKNSSGTTFAQFSVTAAASTAVGFQYRFLIIANSLTAQVTDVYGIKLPATGGASFANANRISGTGTTAVDFSSAQTLTVVMQTSGGNPTANSILDDVTYIVSQ